MARGALVQNGVVIQVTEAASDLSANYGGPGIAFVPDDRAQIGDQWDGKAFTYLVSLPLATVTLTLTPDQLADLISQAQAQQSVVQAAQTVQVDAALALAAQPAKE